MKILIIVAEIAPFSHVGGLARGTRYLSKALSEIGHDVRIMTPLHSCAKSYLEKKQLEYTTHSIDCSSLPFPEHQDSTKFKPKYLLIKKNKFCEQTYLVDYPDYFSLCSRIYGYEDDFKRFYLFSKLCLNILDDHSKTQDWLPDVIQCHDWHTGYFVELIKTNTKISKKLKDIPVLFSVHNFRYQGSVNFMYFDKEDLDMAKEPLAEENDLLLKNQNALSRGMIYADWVNTVSPTHAKEVQSKEYSYNLELVIKKISPKLNGILNGLDYEAFNPNKDRSLHKNYDADNSLRQRAKNKQYLQKLFSLPVNPEGPLFSFVGRMSFQKGLDTLVQVMAKVLKENKNAQLIAVGGGEEYYCELFWQLKHQFPNQVAVKLEHDIHLPKPIFAGSDITLVPSNFEPGGIVLLEAMRYGSVPIIRRTGGMNDVIQDFDKKTFMGNGFSFKNQKASTFYKKINEVLTIFEDKKTWEKLVKNCMTYRRTWTESAKEYALLFDKLTKIKNHE